MHLFVLSDWDLMNLSFCIKFEKLQLGNVLIHFLDKYDISWKKVKLVSNFWSGTCTHSTADAGGFLGYRQMQLSRNEI